MIGRQHYALAIHSQDRRRAALDQDFQLFLGLAPQVLLTPVPHESDHKKPRAGVGQEGKNKTQQDFHAGARDIEPGLQKGADQGERDDFHGNQNDGSQHHRKNVEDSQGRLVPDEPVGHGDQRHQSARHRQNLGPASP